ncbi:uncharacterized protein [Phyllobates terribilis]|uniref:uncharacterized protein n=1 Tax=Phyllobates terribilis TaxID=111132 RepID=UPI003CCAF104
MGLLEKLWDDTVAGPRPDSGLGKLRKYNTINIRSSSGKESDGGSARSMGDESAEKGVRVTRSIMIVKPRGYESGSPLVSPSGSTPPISPAGYSPLTSPFSGSRQAIRIKRSASDAYEKAIRAGARDPSSP